MDELQGFRIGETYRNRDRRYEVVGFSGGTLRVRYEDGTQASLDASIQRRIIDNMARDSPSTQPAVRPPATHPQLRPLNLGPSDDMDLRRRFFATLRHLALCADLQAELPPASVEGFLGRYSQLAGAVPRPGDPGFYVLSEPLNKWGPELRIYFPATPTELDELYFGEDIEVRDAQGDGQYRINNNDFFYDLAAYGFVLGPTQDIDRIRARIPAVFHVYFDGQG